MAKLYKNSNGAFYDAFGGKLGTIEEIEEEWAGDAFNRDTTVAMCNNASFTTASCSIDDMALNSLSGTISINSDGLTCSKSTVGNWDVTFSTKDEVSSKFDSVHEKLKKLQGQIDELKQKKQQEGIRNKLKTLKYEREAE